ncbi:hypothetical protein G9A89_010805 [Geosiphon pyriformis]|nr:hypothetical protein G9A89_010805 [Geosiphon pyriformis]
MLFEWGFGVVFELVVGADKLFGAVADKLPVAVVDKLEVDILVVDRLVAVSLADKWFDIGLDLGSDSEYEICDQGFNIDFPIMDLSQVSGDCFCVPLFDDGKCVGQVIDTIVITKVSQEFCFELIEDLWFGG